MKDIFKNKQFTKFLPLYIVIIAMITLLGTSYSLLRNSQTGSNSYTMNVSTLEINFVDQDTNALTISNMYPMSDQEGLSQNDVLEFTILNNGNLKANYNVYIEETSNNPVMSNVMKYAVSSDNGLTYSESKLLQSDNFIEKNGTLDVNESKSYKVKVWLDESADNTYMNKTFKARVIVEALQYQPTLSETIVNLSSNNLSYLKSYADVLRSNPTFTTQDSYLDNYNKQTVYYFNGEGALRNANVIFGEFCWQIIRTTDTGGVKLLYNGLAENGYDYTSTTILSDTNLTNVTNDATYAYTYNSTTKKWTSTNKANSSTSTFIFSVAESSEYMLEYDVSSQYESDIVHFYKNDVEIQSDSGTNTGTIYLGNLTSSDVLKVTYIKNDNTNVGNDNVVFSIAKVNSKTEKKMCKMNRTATLGINATGSGTVQTMTSASVYGRHFTYDLNAGTFTLEDTITNKTWVSNKDELIGTYTCLSDATTCSTLYYVGSKNQTNANQAYVVIYSIGQVESFTQVGSSPFNANYRSPAMVGYMFNQSYDYKIGNASTYAATVTWDPNNNVYILGNDTSATFDTTHHYACDTDCTKLRFYYSQRNTDNYYILLENGKTEVNALNEMVGYDETGTFTNTNLNTYNSTMKGYLENWYRKNLINLSSYIDQTSVYCNDRNIRDITKLGGWRRDGNQITGEAAYVYLLFRQYNVDQNLTCMNATDRFSAADGNTKAKLEYPIGLLTEPERNLISGTFSKTGHGYWTLSPTYFSYFDALNRYVYDLGFSVERTSFNNYGVRPVVTLSSTVGIIKGVGTYEDPYVV